VFSLVSAFGDFFSRHFEDWATTPLCLPLVVLLFLLTYPDFLNPLEGTKRIKILKLIWMFTKLNIWNYLLFWHPQGAVRRKEFETRPLFPL
jgi:hypothetical protein